MTTYTEAARLDDFVAYEGNPIFTREKVTVLSGQNLLAGAVVGMVTASSKLVAFDNANADGSQNVYGVLVDAVDASAADKVGVAVVRDTVFKKSGLAWKAGVDSAEQAAAIVAMRALGLLVRTDL